LSNGFDDESEEGGDRKSKNQGRQNLSTLVNEFMQKATKYLNKWNSQN
jgi:hypothetical protein